MREHPGEALSAMIDGTLDAAGVTEVEAHLRSCATCRDEADALRATLSDLQALRRPEMVETDRARLHAALSKANATSRTPWNRIGAVAAALVLVVGGGVMLARNGDDASLRAGAPPVITEDDYTEDNARSLLADEAPLLKSGGGTSESAPAADAGAATGPSVMADNQAAIPDIDHAAKIAECEATFLADEDITRLKRIVARFGGEPAYFLTYELPRGAPTHRELWVLGVSDCGVLYFAEQKV